MKNFIFPLIVIAVIVIGIIAYFLKENGFVSEEKGEEGGDKKSPYYRKKYFLTPAEQSFFNALKETLKDKYYIFPQIRLGSILWVSRRGKDWRRYSNKIDKKSVDFVIADKQSLSPVLAIELDDSSHSNSQRRHRDDFVDESLKSAGIKILHVRWQKYYDVDWLREKINSYLIGGEKIASSVGLAKKDSEPTLEKQKESEICPSCGGLLVKKQGKFGDFYGCSNYPKCKYTIKTIE